MGSVQARFWSARAVAALATICSTRPWVLRAGDLTAESLLDRVRNVADAAPRAPLVAGVDGAAETVRIARRIVEDHHAG